MLKNESQKGIDSYSQYAVWDSPKITHILRLTKLKPTKMIHKNYIQKWFTKIIHKNDT